MHTSIGLVYVGRGFALVPQSVSNLKRPYVVYRDIRQLRPQTETGTARSKDNPSPVLPAFIELLMKE